MIDLYCEFIGDFFLGDHILKVVAERDGAVGSEIQDLCVLFDPTCVFFDGACHEFPRKDEGFIFEFPFSGVEHVADGIFPFSSCKNAELFQRIDFSEGGSGPNLPQCTFQ